MNVSARKEQASAVVRFAGDSGDGIQLSGNRFTLSAAYAGNDLATFPDFPAEIRAPAGSLAGVSAFQIQLGDHRVYTAGDRADVLVALNPAALSTNLDSLEPAGVLILDSGAFSARTLRQAGYATSPLEDGSLDDYRVIPVDMSALTLEVTGEFGLRRRDALRARNFFALGMVLWMFEREVEDSAAWIESRFKGDEALMRSNTAALKAGFHFGETAGLGDVRRRVNPAPIGPGLYRNITGNEALALGLMAGAGLADLDLFMAGYPITPASDLLHYLAREKELGVKTFQAEDEIAAACAAIGASYGGALGVTATSGPGLALKSEALGLAVALELPLVVIDVQRAGPSTGMPTKTEQSDLNQAMYGRSGEAPLPVIAAGSPSDCFTAALEAVRAAVEHMTPVILLSDASLANGAEPWRIPELSALAPIGTRRASVPPEGGPFRPFERDERGVRSWAIPGTAGLQHRIGGLEKEDGSGHISYDGPNHELMSRLREAKVAGVGSTSAAPELYGDRQGDVLVITWGGTCGAAREAVLSARERGYAVSHLHLRWLNPLHGDLGIIAGGFRKVIVPELNSGQLTRRIRSEYLVDARALSLMQGRPFTSNELDRGIREALRR
ncbi:MAG: 2-oxoacid:acceptor oxidoreductase subunit alpha [Arenicellales bacterium]